MDRTAVELTATALACGIPAMQVIESMVGRFVHETVPVLPTALPHDEFLMWISSATCADDAPDVEATRLDPAA